MQLCIAFVLGVQISVEAYIVGNLMTIY